MVLLSHTATFSSRLARKAQVRHSEVRKALSGTLVSAAHIARTGHCHLILRQRLPGFLLNDSDEWFPT